MTDYETRLVNEMRDVLRRAADGLMAATDAARALVGLASTMDGSTPAALRDASRELANEVELVAYGGTASGIEEASRRFEAAIASGGSSDIQQR
jgi:hypothetical protein